MSDWWNFALCQEVDPELFFPEVGGDLRRNDRLNFVPASDAVNRRGRPRWRRLRPHVPSAVRVIISLDAYEQLHGPIPDPEPRPGHVTHLTPPDSDGEFGFVCSCTSGVFASGYRTKADALADAGAHERGLD